MANEKPESNELPPADSSPSASTAATSSGACWDLAGRDVVPDLHIQAAPRDVGAAILYAMLRSDGAPWSPPYDDIRSKLGIRKKVIEPERQEQADSRLRTYFVLFRGLGLLHEKEGLLRVTPAGQRLAETLDQMLLSGDEASRQIGRSQRWKLARLAVSTLSRYQLRNPSTASLYPEDADIFPVWSIWKAMRELDDRIHWEEIGRVLTKCLRMSDLDASIESIRSARQDDGYDPNDASVMDATFGPRCPDLGADQQDRIIVWLSRAGFKDVLIEHRNRPDGYRYLQAEFLPLIDEALQDPPVYKTFSEPDDYFEWLGSAEPSWSIPTAKDAEAALLDHAVGTAQTFGKRSIIALVGVAGAGKTRMAQMVADALTEGDRSHVGFVQFHAAFTYEEFIGGLAPKEEGGFEFRRGVLLEINRLAQKDPENTYVLVIDELSRADVANVLGELLTYIEYRNLPFRVAGLGEDVELAPNLTVVVTMNPADRSVINMDEAVVRRVRFVEVPPSASALRLILDEAGMPISLRDQVVEWFQGLPPDAPFGHGLFVDVASEEDLFRLWNEQLRFFIRRGGITTYPNPSAIESGYRWKTEPPSEDAGGQDSSVASINDAPTSTETPVEAGEGETG